MRPLSALALLASSLLGACGVTSSEPAPPRPRLVVLYASCTLNTNFLGPYGRRPASGNTGIEGVEAIRFTPSLDRLAREGVVFERHQTEAAQSGIAFASIFTGTQADVHGIYYHPNELADGLTTITEAFAEAGYEPWFWSGHEMASYDLNYGQGVAADHVSTAQGARKRAQKLAFLQPGDPQLEAVLTRLAREPDYRAFLLVNFTVTHGAYGRQLPAGVFDAFLEHFPEVARRTTRAELERWWKVYEANRLGLQWDFPRTVAHLGLSEDDVVQLARALEVTYAADVWGLDTLVGNTLAELERRGLLDATLFAFTADHGEVLHRPGALYHWTHDLGLAPEELAVPWIVRAPALGLAPRRYAGVTCSIDVFPTLAGLCAIDVAGRGPLGRDLSAELRAGREAPPEIAWSHTTAIGPDHVEEFKRWELAGRFFGTTDVNRIWVRARDGDRVFKLRNLDGERWGTQLFNLAQDPWEEHDLFDAADPAHVEMARRLEEYKQRLVRAFGSARLQAPADAVERLKDMGYVGGDEEGPSSEDKSPGRKP
jgi:arylsulfatase A-like enzyme